MSELPGKAYDSNMFEVFEYVGADGKPLRYGKLSNPEKSASGKAMLFLPGLGGSVKGAVHFLEQLLPRYDVIYGPDLRGFGLNPLETPLYNAQIIQQDIEAFYQRIIAPNHHAELTLCGISLGGVLATSFAVQHPEYFQKLILLAPAYKPHPKSFSLSYTVRNILAHLILGRRARTQLPYDLTSVTRNEAILNDPQYLNFPSLLLTPGFLLGVRALCVQAMRDVPRITLPTMMVVPGEDIVCDPDAMRKAFYNLSPDTTKVLKEYPDFYHDVLFEAGHSDIAQEVLSWFPVSTSAESIS